MAREHWVQNQNVRLQLLESGEPGAGTPLLMIPGTPAPASDWLPVMEALNPRQTFAASLRGHQPSDAPETGYALADFTSDVGAVVEQLGLPGVCLLGFSIASTYVLAYAASQPDRVRGLVILDWPARYPAFPPEFADRVLAQADPEFFRPVVVRGIQRDSRLTELWDLLPRITCPVLILRAGQPGGSRLSEEDAQRYLDTLPSAQLITFPESGHDVRRPSLESFVAKVQQFLDSIDGR